MICQVRQANSMRAFGSAKLRLRRPAKRYRDASAEGRSHIGSFAELFKLANGSQAKPGAERDHAVAAEGRSHSNQLQSKNWQ